MGTAIVKPSSRSFASSGISGLVPGILSNRHRFERVFTCLEIAGDTVIVTLSVLVSYWIYEFLGIGRRLHYSAVDLIAAALAFAVLYVVLLDRDGSYSAANSLLGIRETERVLRVSLTAFSLVFCVTFFSTHWLSRAVLVCAAAVAPLSLIFEKQLILRLIRHLHSRGYGIQKVVIYGAGATGRRLFSALVRSPKLGLRPLAIVDDDERLHGKQVFGCGYRREYCISVIAGPITEELLRNCDAGLLLIGIPSLSREKRDHLASEARAAECAVAFVPQLSHSSESANGPLDIDGVLVACLLPPVARPFYDFSKRLFDIAISTALILITAPVWALIALLVRLDSSGPIFFEHTRIGRNGIPFQIYKFRSMYVDAPKYGYHPQHGDDPRVTRIGRWLRRSSLDELPQLLNVLKGEMSLVGPRPEMPFIVEKYNEDQRQRLAVIPGITGLWQLSADRAFSIHENLQYDLYYIGNRNFFMDLALLLHTAMFAMRGV